MDPFALLQVGIPGGMELAVLLLLSPFLLLWWLLRSLGGSGDGTE